LDDEKELDFNEDDLKYYSQKFNIPDSLSMKIMEDSPNIKAIKELKDKVKDRQVNAALIHMANPGLTTGNQPRDNPLADLSPKEEEERLEKINTDINKFLNRLENVPQSYYEEIPDSQNLLNFMKNTVNTIEKARDFNIERIRTLNWIVESQIQANNELDSETQEPEIISAPTLSMPSKTGDLIPEGSFFRDALSD